ncbi:MULTISPECIES: hypothetical protein [Mycolicibacter]|uniref:Uncharacterized protein n=2 Tax=Mycolicibacter TaxID=1073531 RepID=A0ABU5XPC8_9MYCO|nr:MULTISPECIES: hypothetical protein [unclassified Mycolicibacter]MEB3022931.1 hypothetical protein [Mycolicibacter sp. MYC098]MEB3034974.1 hypothetical protein [Mycolicibacter sp. MYC340]
MTSFGLDARGSGAGQQHVTPPPLSAPHYDAPGGHANVLDDILRAGLDPAGAFGAAAGLHRVVGLDPVNRALNTVANPANAANGAGGGSPTNAAAKGSGNATGQAAAKGSGNAASQAAAKSSGNATAQAAAKSSGNAAGKAAAKGAQSSLSRAMAKNALHNAAQKTASGLAANRGAALAGKLTAKMALRAGAMSIPALGAGLTAAMWVLDSGERQAVNNLISSLFGPGAAPELDAAPEPPRTSFLPLTHDGNRDPAIERMDQGMVRTNAAAFHFHPDDVWPSAPRIETTSDFGAVATKINGLASKVGSLSESIQSVYTTAAAEEPTLQRLWSQVKPGVTALDGLKDTVLPAIGRQLLAGAGNANDAYQALREVNRVNRVEINNSTTGLIPFRANHVDEGKMGDSAAQLRAATEAMDRTAQALASAADPFTIVARSGVPGAGGNAPAVQSSVQQDAGPAPVISSPGGAAPATPPVTAGAENPVAKDLASLLRNGMPAMPMMPGGMGMPTMPSIPGLGSGIPGLGNAMARPADATLARDTDPLKKGLDEQLKDRAEKADEKAAKKPGEGPLGTMVSGPGAGAAQPAVNKVGPALGEPGTPGGPPGAANTTEIGGKKWTFDNPKSAALAHNMSGTDGSSNKSLRQAAAEAGFRLPPPGQDIGTPVPGADIKPGDVIMGANNQNACYLGEQDGRAMAITERGELKPLDEVMKITGPHEGIFRLVDDGAPAADEQVIQKTAADAAPAATSTDPGIIPTPPRGGQPGMDPGAVPPGN